jgi:hypothetical protein
LKRKRSPLKSSERRKYRKYHLKTLLDEIDIYQETLEKIMLSEKFLELIIPEIYDLEENPYKDVDSELITEYLRLRRIKAKDNKQLKRHNYIKLYLDLILKKIKLEKSLRESYERIKGLKAVNYQTKLENAKYIIWKRNRLNELNIKETRSLKTKQTLAHYLDDTELIGLVEELMDGVVDDNKKTIIMTKKEDNETRSNIIKRIIDESKKIELRGMVPLSDDLKKAIEDVGLTAYHGTNDRNIKSVLEDNTLYKPFITFDKEKAKRFGEIVIEFDVSDYIDDLFHDTDVMTEEAFLSEVQSGQLYIDEVVSLGNIFIHFKDKEYEVDLDNEDYDWIIADIEKSQDYAEGKGDGKGRGRHPRYFHPHPSK